MSAASLQSDIPTTRTVSFHLGGISERRFRATVTVLLLVLALVLAVLVLTMLPPVLELALLVLLLVLVRLTGDAMLGNHNSISYAKCQNCLTFYWAEDRKTDGIRTVVLIIYFVYYLQCGLSRVVISR